MKRFIICNQLVRKCISYHMINNEIKCGSTQLFTKIFPIYLAMIKVIITAHNSEYKLVINILYSQQECVFIFMCPSLFLFYRQNNAFIVLILEKILNKLFVFLTFRCIQLGATHYQYCSFTRLDRINAPNWTTPKFGILCTNVFCCIPERR